MNNVSENTQVSVKQTQKDVESYLAFSALLDYRSHNPDHSREAADLAPRVRIVVASIKS